MGFSLVWMESEGRGLVWRGHLYWAVGSPVYVGYVVASGGLGFLIGKFNWFGLLCIIGVC